MFLPTLFNVYPKIPCSSLTPILFCFHFHRLLRSGSVRPPNTVGDDHEKSLKYLDFVQVAAFYVVVCFTSIYEFAKENFGSLKPSVQTVEGTVKTVIGPVYEKFQDVPFELLKLVDRQVGESITELERHFPSLIKQASTQAFTAAQKAPEVARGVASEVKRAGVVDTAKNISKTVYTKYEPSAKEIYTRYEPVAEQYAVSAWCSLNRHPLFPQVAQIIVPTAAYWSKKYNQAVCYTSDRGYTWASCVPLIPTDMIAKVFGGAMHGHNDATGEACVMAQ